MCSIWACAHTVPIFGAGIGVSTATFHLRVEEPVAGRIVKPKAVRNRAGFFLLGVEFPSASQKRGARVRLQYCSKPESSVPSFLFGVPLRRPRTPCFWHSVAAMSVAPAPKTAGNHLILLVSLP